MQSPVVKSIDSASAWSRVLAHAPTKSLLEMFRVDAERSRNLMFRAGELTVDFSRQKVDVGILGSLVEAAAECDVRDALTQMFSGRRINTTERRTVGHVAVRMLDGEVFEVDGVDVVPEIRASLARLSAFAQAIRRSEATGSTGRSFSAVVNIGIGGSDLGPRLVHEALRNLCHERISCRFVANVDPEDFAANVSDLDPSETLIIVSSKTFTTTETLLNARMATDWIRRHLGDAAVAAHVVAVSADERAVKASGLGAGLVFPLWDWVGGRYSVGTAIGLSAMIAVGSDAFGEMLAGMRDLDEHVRQVESSNNVPLVMALIGIWNHAVLGCASRAVIPYSHALRRLPAYLQQLMMESNGKSTRLDGSSVSLPTSPIIWGDEGTNSQHAFMQLLHQGTSVVPVDFIGFARPSGEPMPGGITSHKALFMNMVAQAQALAFGRTSDEPHRSFAGDRPSTVITARELTPRVLGQIIALYEHATFYEGILLGINSFDQWGVELGKELAASLMSTNLRTEGKGSIVDDASLHLLEWFDSETRPATDR